MGKELDELFEMMANDIVPNFLQVMAALNDITNLVTPSGDAGDSPTTPTVCELNGRHCTD